jgi:hypothetical protein
LNLPTKRLGLVLAGLLVIHAAYTTDYWSTLAGARWFVTDRASYQQHRLQAAFHGFPMDRLREALDAYVPGTGRIALSERIRRDEFLKQRLAEALYPRVVDARAAFVLDLLPVDEFVPGVGREVLRLDGDRVMVLRGAKTRLNRPTPVAESFSFDAFRLVGSVVSVLGFGLLVALLAPGLWRRKLGLLVPFALLAGAVVVGLTASLATWFQLPLVHKAFGAVGLALAVVTPVLLVRRGLVHVAGMKWPSPEAWCLAALVVLALAAASVTPLSEWDARSTWLFRAKQIHAHHGLALSDATQPDSQWSHLSYPLLLPAWFAQFTLFSTEYNERLAAMGGAMLLAVLLALIWVFAREQLGRWVGAALTFVLFFTADKWVAAGYADTLLMLFLALAFFALTSAHGEGIGWLAVVASSLTKEEGLVLGALIAVPFLLRRPWAWRRMAFGGLLLLPAALHVIWAKVLHLTGDFDHIRWGDVVYTLGWRLKVIGVAVWRATGPTPLLLDAAVAVAAAAILVFAYRRRERTALIALGIAAGYFAFVVFAFAATPRELRWHLATALDRLMFHPALFAVLAPFLLLSSGAADAGSTTVRTSR